MNGSRLPKKDLFGDIRMLRVGPAPCIVRDSDAATFRTRRLAHYLLRREASVLAGPRGGRQTVVTSAIVSVYSGAMNICHQHNFVGPATAGGDRRYGIRVTLPGGDMMRKILGDNWEKLHWYATEADRDRAFERMAVRHGYYRRTDNPTQILEKIVR